MKDFILYLSRIKKILLHQDIFIKKDIKLKTVTLGNEHAKWTFCPNDLLSGFVLSFGVGNDISFELELIKKYSINVSAFDPTPESIEWIKTQQDLKYISSFKFYPIGISNYDGIKRFYKLNYNKDSVGYTSTYASSATMDSFVDCHVRKFRTILDVICKGDKHRISILKLDIEGDEYDVLLNLLENDELVIYQILVEFHHRFKNIGVEKTINIIELLKKKGYLIFNVSKTGDEISFVNKKFL